ATAGTLESERYRRLLRAHGSRVEVLGRVCHDWAGLVEQGELDGPTSRASVAREIRPLLDSGADTLVLGCTHFPFLAPLIAEFAHSKWNSQIVLTRVDRPEQYGVAELSDDGRIVNLIEKPKNPPSDLALVGIYMFDASIMEAVKAITPSWRGELEITDAIQWLVDNARNVHPYVHRGWWIDTGRPGDMLEANDLVLEELKYTVDGYVDRDSKVGRRVKIEKGAEIINSVVRGPAIIGEDTRLVNSYIGPFTSIYHHVTVEDSEIEHSVVLEYSTIKRIEARIQDSLIGRYVTIERSPMRPKAHKVTLGDHSQVGIL
ncbi:MAG: sugar phosphate nucleotidyltransferase, partial [Candidatus Promineifilaceae bacterium]